MKDTKFNFYITFDHRVLKNEVKVRKWMHEVKEKSVRVVRVNISSKSFIEQPTLSFTNQYISQFVKWLCVGFKGSLPVFFTWRLSLTFRCFLLNIFVLMLAGLFLFVLISHNYCFRLHRAVVFRWKSFSKKSLSTACPALNCRQTMLVSGWWT